MTITPRTAPLADVFATAFAQRIGLELENPFMCPESLAAAINAYAFRRVLPASPFLRAVLANDLSKAAYEADATERLLLVPIAKYVEAHCAPQAIGSVDRVVRWVRGEEVV